MRFSWYFRLFLEKLGMSEWKAFGYENKISRWEEWILRHPITILSVSLPTEIADNKWHKVTASLDNTHVKLVSETGIWRKTYIWQSMAKIDSQYTESNISSQRRENW